MTWLRKIQDTVTKQIPTTLTRYNNNNNNNKMAAADINQMQQQPPATEKGKMH